MSSLGGWSAPDRVAGPLQVARRLGFTEPMLRRGAVLAPVAGLHVLIERSGAGLLLAAEWRVDPGGLYLLDVWAELDGTERLRQPWATQTQSEILMAPSAPLGYQRGLRLLAQTALPNLPRWLAVEATIGLSGLHGVRTRDG
jgi:hypothetical protein